GNKTPGENKTPERNPEEGSTNNGIGWGENHLWGKDEDVWKSLNKKATKQKEKAKIQKLNQKKDQTLNQAKKIKDQTLNQAKKDKDPKTEQAKKIKDQTLNQAKKDKDPKTESSTKAKDPETQSGKPVVKPMVRVTENTSENSKVKKVNKYWDGVTPEDKKKAIESGKFWAEHWGLE
ncbi:hypothetical protein FCM47_04025, partial [Mycoplasma bovis]|nr:hypothetical protein [Mycoplasmopsis bovis]